MAVDDPPFPKAGITPTNTATPLRTDASGVLQYRRAPQVVELYSGPASGFATLNHSLDPTVYPGRLRATVIAHTNATTPDGLVDLRVRFGDFELIDFEQVSEFYDEPLLPGGLAFSVVGTWADPRSSSKAQFFYRQLSVFDGFPKLNLQLVNVTAATVGEYHVVLVLD